MKNEKKKHETNKSLTQMKFGVKIEKKNFPWNFINSFERTEVYCVLCSVER